MNTQRILTKKAGQTFDMDLLSYMLSQQPNAFGFAVQDGTGATPELSIVRETGTPTMEQMEEFLENAKDFQALVYLGQLGSKFNKDDIQPFILSDSDGAPFLTIGIEGDFSKFADPASGHTEEFNFATKIILPTLSEICEFADGDLDKIMEKVNGTLFNNVLLSNIGHRGSLTILGLEGDPVWLGNNNLGGAYDWGQTSNEHDYAGFKAQRLAAATKATEVKAAATTPVVEKVKKTFGFRGKAGDKPVASGTPPIIPQDVATPGTAPRASVPSVSQVGATTIKDVKEPSEPRVIKIPPWVHSNDDIKAYYGLVLGHVPDKWKKRIPIMNPVVDKLPENEVEFLQMRADAKKAELAKPTVITKQERVTAAKTETASGAPKSGAEIAIQRAEETQPMLNAKEVEEMLELVSAIPENKMSVTEMADIEQKLGKFSASVGVTLQEMLNWPFQGLFAIASKKPKAMVLAFLEARAEIRELQKHVIVGDLVNTEHANDKVVTTTKKLGNNTTLTESHVIAKEELKPAKKTFGFRNKAA